MTTYRAGVIGLNLGQSHVRGFDEADGVEVAAVCDIDEQRLEEVADQYDVPSRYTDATAMLETESLDIVSVTTPAALHPMMTLLAARYPVQAIISEKPLANSMGEADAMLATCNAAGIKLLCGYQGRHMRAFGRARDLIADGAIGKPLAVKVSVEEGGLLNQGSHLIDRALYLLGDPEPLWVLGQVQRETDRYERGYYCEDLCFCIAAVEGGARIIYDNDIGPHGDLGNRAFVVTGDDGVLIVEPSDPAISMSFGIKLTSGNREDLNEPWDGVETNFMQEQAKELVAWLNGDIDGHRQDGHHAIKSQSILIGLYESARTHTLVQVPIQTKLAPLEAAINEGALKGALPGRVRHPSPARLCQGRDQLALLARWVRGTAGRRKPGERAVRSAWRNARSDRAARSYSSNTALRSVSFTRVCQPFPVSRKWSTRSASSRRVIWVFVGARCLPRVRR